MKLNLAHILPLLALSLTACNQDGFQPIQSLSSGAGGLCAINKIQRTESRLAAQSPFITQKVSLIESPQISEAKLVMGDELVALVDNNCVRENPGPWSASIVAQGSAQDLELQAYPFRMDANMDPAIFENEMNQDNCIIGVSNQKYFRANAVPNDLRYVEQLHLPNLRASEAWDIFYDPQIGINKEIVIAVVDTGIDYNHPDLVNQMWTDANGNHGRDFVNNDDEPLDDNFHGTHVAGLAGAESNNQLGGSGIMGASAQLMAVKVLDAEGLGLLSDIINGIRYAAEQGAHVINLSFGGPGESAMILDALVFAVNQGSVVVAAAGNDGVEITNDNFFTPSGYAKDIPGMISVGATNSADRSLTGYSNYSSTYVEISAPGSMGLLSTTPNNTYFDTEGTSMASPLVAGAAGLALGLFSSRGAQLSPQVLEEILIAGSVADPNLAATVKDGRHLDLLTLAQHTSGISNLTFTTQPETQSALLGETVQFVAELSTTEYATLQWLKDGVALEGETSQTLSLEGLDATDGGQYQLQIDQLGRVVSSEAAQLNLFKPCQ